MRFNIELKVFPPHEMDVHKTVGLLLLATPFAGVDKKRRTGDIGSGMTRNARKKNGFVLATYFC